MAEEKLSTERKALTVNLNPLVYGTFAEIGAGQEVARNFFKVGAAAGTIAKTMSAYDMKFSDAIYGKCSRYVSKERLNSMLQHEYSLLVERLAEQRGKETTFFAFANTVSARNFKGTNECHGWMGVRLQLHPGQAPNDVILHVRMKDKENFLQAQAIGIFGVNLLYGAFYYRDDPDKFIASLLDDLSVDRIEVDMMELTGPDFEHVDARIVSLKLLQLGLTNAVMFGAEKTVYQPSEVLYKKPVLLERGSFRPVTYVNTDMLESAQKQFCELPEVKGKEVVTLVEITLSNLLSAGMLDLTDFLARADTVSALGYKVLVTNYPEFFKLPSYFRRYTQEMVAMVLGINNLLQIFEEHFYKDLEGGLLEAVGRLFHNKIELLVYPMSVAGYKRYASTDPEATKISVKPGQELITARDVLTEGPQRHLYAHLLDRGHIVSIEGFNAKYLDIFSRDVLEQIKKGDGNWEKMVPPAAATVIKARGMFGYKRPFLS